MRASDLPVDQLSLTSGPRKPGSLGRGGTGTVLRILGAGLLISSGAIHLDLYLTGYRTIPTIGWLFLLQVISAFALGAIVLASPSWLAAAAGAGFALATLGGYLLSLRISLFGFREVRTEAGVVAGVLEVATFAVLAASAVGPGSRLSAPRAAIVTARWGAAAGSATAALLLGVSLAVSGPASTGAGSPVARIAVATVHGVQVLTNARAFTLYWFAPDTPTKPTCYGTCALYWPPVTSLSPPTGSGLTGKLDTVRRSGGAPQVTYRGHPLYTYVGDSSPGQANGNNIDLNGGYWYEMTAG